MIVCFLKSCRWRSVTWKLDRVDYRRKSKSCSIRLSQPPSVPVCCLSLLLPRPRLPLLPSCRGPSGPIRVSMVTKWTSAMFSGHNRRSTGCRQKSRVWRQRWLTGGGCLRYLGQKFGSYRQKSVCSGGWISSAQQTQNWLLICFRHHQAQELVMVTRVRSSNFKEQ